MFNPNRDQVRQFFFDTWRKHRDGVPLSGLEPVAADVLVLHPEYHALLDDPAGNATREWTAEDGATNPFLHLSMHLAIEEQLAIDQPAGVVAAFGRLMARTGDRHAAVHRALECLGEMLWRSQRDHAPPDGEAYLQCLRAIG
jgi:Domain of unknown function (DUF1841)